MTAEVAGATANVAGGWRRWSLAEASGVGSVGAMIFLTLFFFLDQVDMSSILCRHHDVEILSSIMIDDQQRSLNPNFPRRA